MKRLNVLLIALLVVAAGAFTFHTANAEVNTPMFSTIKRGIATVIGNTRYSQGTTTPAGAFSIYARLADPSILFNVSSSTPSGTSTPLMVTRDGVGMGTTSPSVELDISSSGTTTASLDTQTTKGGCLKVKTDNGTGYVYFVARATTGTWATTTAANCQ